MTRGDRKGPERSPGIASYSGTCRVIAAIVCAVAVTLFLAHRLRDAETDSGAARPDNSRGPRRPDAKGLYARAELRWAAAYLFKPDRQLDRQVEFSLAPLLLGRSDETDPGSRQRHAFGALTRGAGGEFEIDLTKPTIYYGESTAILRGKEYRQLHYRWWYSAASADSADSAESAPSPEAGQAFRMTLDDAGHPAIWEVLRDVSGARPVFVATPLEEAAREEFGEPLPERRYSIEAGLTDAPDVIVPRVVSPGPVPMGPFLYLDDSSHSVTTLICRCMPSQFDKLAGDIEYELRPLSDLEAQGLDADRWTGDFPREKGKGEPAFDEAEDPGWLERCLRLPAF